MDFTPHRVFRGDCVAWMKTLPANSVDSIVTDPPYELGFMGKAWDASGVAYRVELWQEALRILKPGGHLLAFGGSRTYHRMACAIEDAGFEIRDQIMWVYGSGFPKSLDVSKAIDEAAGATREETGKVLSTTGNRADGSPAMVQSGLGAVNAGPQEHRETLPATDAAKQWAGWGTALKPAHEPIVVARKPLIGTVIENVLVHGTGGLNVDGCRVTGEVSPAALRRDSARRSGVAPVGEKLEGPGRFAPRVNADIYMEERPGEQLGRWPANFIHDGSPEVVDLFPANAPGCSSPSSATPESKFRPDQGGYQKQGPIYGDEGSAARFFYCAKPSQAERGEVNEHPTVKPLALIRHLVKLVTPLGGVVVDPFLGSGTALLACDAEGMVCWGAEKNAQYIGIIGERWKTREPRQEAATEAPRPGVNWAGLIATRKKK